MGSNIFHVVIYPVGEQVLRAIWSLCFSPGFRNNPSLLRKLQGHKVFSIKVAFILLIGSLETESLWTWSNPIRKKNNVYRIYFWKTGQKWKQKKNFFGGKLVNSLKSCLTAGDILVKNMFLWIYRGLKIILFKLFDKKKAIV